MREYAERRAVLGCVRSKTMIGMTKALAAAAMVLAAGSVASAQTDVTLRVNGNAKVERLKARYQCDAAAGTVGLPAGAFTVRYINAGDNHLAIVPVNGQELIFSSVLAATGGRYVARQFQWWTARETTFTLNPDAVEPKSTTCREID